MNKLSPNLIVDDIEACLPFWVDRLGFTKTVEVPHESKLGFVILVRDTVEVMLQSAASVAADVPAMAGGAYRSVLFVEVPDLAPIRTALEGLPLVTPERTTAYGTTEIIVKDPAGNVVFFAQH